MKQELDALRAESSALRSQAAQQADAAKARAATSDVHTPAQYRVDVTGIPTPPPLQPRERKKTRGRGQQQQGRGGGGGTHATSTHRFEYTGAPGQAPEAPVPTTAAAAGAVPERFRRPAAIKMLTLLDLWGAISLAAVAFTLTLQNPEPRPQIVELALYLSVGFALLFVLTALSVWRLRPIGHTLQRLVMLPLLLAVPFGSVYAFLVLVYLARPAIKLLFSGRSPREMNAAEIKAVESSTKLSPAIALLLLIFVWAPIAGATTFMRDIWPVVAQELTQMFPALAAPSP